MFGPRGALLPLPLCVLSSVLVCSASLSDDAPESNKSCKQGLAEVELLRQAVAFFAKNSTSRGSLLEVSGARSPQTLKVSIDTRTVYIDYGTGVQALIFPSGRAKDRVPTIQTLGDVPSASQIPSETWEFIKHCVAWIHADVNFDGEAQTNILDPDAHCFGLVGSKAVVDGNLALSKSIAFSAPHTIQLDFDQHMVIWDFDIVSRDTCTITGRGTDFVHLRKETGQVFQVDTVRHMAMGEQPDWVRAQFSNPYPSANVSAEQPPM